MTLSEGKIESFVKVPVRNWQFRHLEFEQETWACAVLAWASILAHAIEVYQISFPAPLPPSPSSHLLLRIFFFSKTPKWDLGTQSTILQAFNIAKIEDKVTTFMTLLGPWNDCGQLLRNVDFNLQIWQLNKMKYLYKKITFFFSTMPEKFQKRHHFFSLI